jgi:hypothetical protein
MKPEKSFNWIDEITGYPSLNYIYDVILQSIRRDVIQWFFFEEKGDDDVNHKKLRRRKYMLMFIITDVSQKDCELSLERHSWIF